MDGTSEDEEVSRYEAIAVGAANKADGIHNDANNTTMQVGEQARQIEAIQRGIGTAARMRLIPDCKHSPHLEQPDVTLALITGFVESLG